MSRRLLFLGAVLIAAISLLFSRREPPQHPPYVQGKNKTALFLVNQEHGLSNVHLATASSLLENYPDIEVHFASFRKIGTKLERIARFSRKRTPEARDIIFHELQGPSYADAIFRANKTLANIPHPPGSAGVGHLCKDIQVFVAPWTAEDHLALYQELGPIIDQVDPAVIVLDTLFRPGLDATRDKNRAHAIITPNGAVDNFLADQPYGSMFWKYPAMSSGFPFPVPWRKIPENIYLNMRFIYSVVVAPDLAAKRKVLRENGLKDPINFFAMYRSDVPWITMTTEGASVPLDVVPDNVTFTGPMVVSVAPAAEQDPGLYEWLKKAPTVLINLGSTVNWTETQASAMAAAAAHVMDKTDVQILWKFVKDGQYSDNFSLPIKPHLESGRLKMQRWLTVDPTSLLETGHFVASVHHGGANCYNEALYAGVPHLILPMWADLYQFAALAESVGVGVWGCRGTNPGWTVEGLTQSLLKVVDSRAASISMRQRAKQLGDRIRNGERGRDIAARRVAEMSYAGKA